MAGECKMDSIRITPIEFDMFRKLIYKHTGISLSEAKKQLVQSRLQKRLAYHKLHSFQEYYDLLLREEENGEEFILFTNSITTNKTDFFRESHHFQMVSQRIIPEIVERVQTGKAPPKIRVWHAGCSTGEEPYTLAITLAEALQRRGNWDIRQLASDIDTQVLWHAEQGVYTKERTESIPRHLLKKYFLHGKGEQAEMVRVREELRTWITFSQINLLDPQWPFRSNMQFDMIFCRSVVIYFDKATQHKLLSRFEKHLRPGGYLFLGHSESLLGANTSFEPCCQTVYRIPEEIKTMRRAA